MKTNDATRARAEALPEINRRRLILGLAAASTAAAAVTIDASAAPAENPKLIALAAELPAIAAAYCEVYDEYRATYDEWDAQTPWAPDEMTIRGVGWPNDVPNQPGTAETRVLGGFLWRVGDDCPRRIVASSWDFYLKLLDARRKKRRAKKAGALADFMAAEADEKRLKKLHKAAQSYEQKFREIKAQASAWHSVAGKVRSEQQEALELHIAAIMAEEDFTVEGLLIKAQALAEWDRIGGQDKFAFAKVAFLHGKDWHGQIAASILRHAKGGDA